MQNRRFGEFFLSHIEKTEEGKDLIIFKHHLKSDVFFIFHLSTISFNDQDSTINFDFEKDETQDIEDGLIIKCIDSFIKASLKSSTKSIHLKEKPLYPIDGKSFYERPVFKYIEEHNGKHLGVTLCFLYDIKTDSFKVSYSKKNKKDRHCKRIANNIAYQRMLDNNFILIDERFITNSFFHYECEYVEKSNHKRIFEDHYNILIDDILSTVLFKNGWSGKC